MKESDKQKGSPSLRERFRSESKTAGWARELLWVVLVVGGVALALFLVSGTWPAVVTIESESMVPHMQVGDLVFVVAQDRYGPLQDWTEGKESGYMKFGDYGDVLIYRPNGADNSVIPLVTGGVHPIIHRAMVTTDAGVPIPQYINLYRGLASPVVYLPATIENNQLVLANGTVINESTANPDIGYIVQSSVIAANPGYITKGDNNQVSDQGSYLSNRSLGVIQPVEKDWIVGKALFTIPLLGYLPLNIVPVAIVIILIMIAWEYYVHRKKKEELKKEKNKSVAKPGTSKKKK
jgi:signal peptidase